MNLVINTNHHALTKQELLSAMVIVAYMIQATPTEDYDELVVEIDHYAMEFTFAGAELFTTSYALVDGQWKAAN
jgi:hypothetical protein